MKPQLPPKDHDAFGELHQELAPQLVRLAWAILRDWSLAADAVQEAFLQFAARETSISEEHVRGWLVKTVQYSALNLRRSQTRQQQRQHRAQQVGEIRSEYILNSAEPEAELREDIERMRAAIDALPTEQQQIVKLRLGDDKSFAEIAEELTVPLGTVLSRMRLALEKLRRRLNDQSQ